MKHYTSHETTVDLLEQKIRDVVPTDDFLDAVVWLELLDETLAAEHSCSDT